MNRRLTRRTVMAGTAATAAVGLAGCLQNPDAGSGAGTSVERYSEGDAPAPAR